MPNKNNLLRSAWVPVLALGVAHLGYAGPWGGSIGSSFNLDIALVCESGNYAGEYVTNPGTDTEPATVEYFYPRDPDGDLDPTTSPNQFVKCNGVSDLSGRQSVDYYSLYLKYTIPPGPTSSGDCPDDNNGHGNDCPKDDKDNPSGKPGPGGGGSSTGISSAVEICADLTPDDFEPLNGPWLTTYTAYCEADGATVEGYLEWRASADGDNEKPFWLNPDDMVPESPELSEFACTDATCGCVDPECMYPRLDFSGFPEITETKGKKTTTFVDLDACTALFPANNFFTPGPFGFEERPIAERQVLLVKEEFYTADCDNFDDPAAEILAEKELLQAYGRHCHNDYKLNDNGDPIPCFIDEDSTVVDGQGVVNQAIVDFQIILAQTLATSPTTINLNECPDNGIVKAVILGEPGFNVRRIAGLGTDLADPLLPQIDPVDPALAPRLIPFNANSGQNDPMDSLFEEFAVSYSYVPADDRNAEFDFINNDTLEDVRIAYKTCLDLNDDPDTANPVPGPSGFAQIVKGGYPDSDMYPNGPNGPVLADENGTVDIQLLGITINPANSEPDREFEDGSSFRSREFDHRVNKL